MRPSKLREYVIDLMSCGELYLKEQVVDAVNKYFGEGMYTSKQVGDLLYNLKREEKIEVNENKEYKIKKSFKENDEMLDIELYLTEIKKNIQLFMESVNEPQLMQRIKESKYSFAQIADLYNMFDKISQKIE